MDSRELAAKVIGAKNKEEAARILSEDTGVADVELAYAIKEICYESWTKEPTVAQKAAAALEFLAKSLVSREITYIGFWIRGISDITEGRLDDALQKFRDAFAGFVHLGKMHEAAQTQVAKLIPLGLLGNYERAEEVGMEALATFSSLGDELAAGKIEMNLSNIASRQGKHRKARKFCISAVGRFSDVGESDWLVMAENDLAHTLAELNEFEEAYERYSRALEITREKQMHLTEAEILASLGNLQTFRGQYGEALRYLEMSRRKFEQLSMPHQTAIADLEIAEIYQILNLTVEAGEIYERVTDLLGEFKLRGEEARSRANLGKLFLLNGDPESAKAELGKAVVLFEDENNPSGKAQALLLQARLHNLNNSPEDALERVNAVKTELEKGIFPRLELETGQIEGETLRLLGRSDEAERLIRKTVESAERSEQHGIATSGLVSLAQIAIEQGRIGKSERFLLKAVEIIEHLRQPIPAEEFRMSFLSDKLAPFEMLSRVCLLQGKAEEAFLYVERGRARTLVELIDFHGPLESEESDEYNKLREQLNWFYSRLSKSESSSSDTRNKIAEIEKRLAEVGLRQSSLSRLTAGSSQAPGLMNLVDDLKRKLGDRRALLEFTRNDGNFSAFVISGSGVTHFENIASEAEILDLIEGFRFQIETFRYGRSVEAFEEQLIRAANACLKELYELLLAPFEEILEDKQLIIVPVSSLFYVPFNALYDGRKYLIQTREIIMSPGAAVWERIDAGDSGSLENALVIGFADESIPLVEAEADIVGAKLESGSVLKGKDANIKNYFKHSGDCGLIHFACHGEFRPDSPMYSNLKLSDGNLTVRDIASRKLNARLVTLSACETGLNKVFAGEEILGLARGFLTAGAQNLVMSLWTVNDSATASLMERFYEGISSGKTIPKALQDAQCEMIAAAKHPYFWAPFGIIGK